MDEILKSTLLGLFFGTFGTTLGGILGVVIKKNSNKFLSFILAFASGLMMAVICFDLIPEALEISSIINIIVGIFIGIIAMICCDLLIEKKFSTNKRFEQEKNTLLKTGIIVSIGLAIHNFPEGLAIGSGFEASMKLGLSLALAICLHDIPERNINGYSYEKWRNESFKNNFLCCIIRNYNRCRCIFWSTYRFNIKRNNSYLFKFCSWCYAIYCIWRINTRIKQTVSWKNDSFRKYVGIYNRNFCNRDLGMLLKISFNSDRETAFFMNDKNTKKCLKNLQFLLTFKIKNYIIAQENKRAECGCHPILHRK